MYCLACRGGRGGLIPSTHHWLLCLIYIVPGTAFRQLIELCQYHDHLMRHAWLRPAMSSLCFSRARSAERRCHRAARPPCCQLSPASRVTLSTGGGRQIIHIIHPRRVRVFCITNNTNTVLYIVLYYFLYFVLSNPGCKAQTQTERREARQSAASPAWRRDHAENDSNVTTEKKQGGYMINGGGKSAKARE